MDNLAFIPLLKATWETIYIVFASSAISVLLGSVVGLVLFLTRDKQLFANKPVHQLMSFIVNVTRSVPFVILMISILPMTRVLVGTTIGANAAIVPLALAAIPFFARVCENAFAGIPHGIIETANSLGVSLGQLITKVLIPESLPALIRGITLTVIALIGYSAMAGAVGGGGLGELAINYGYQRFDVLVTLETVIVLVVLVQLVQFAGDYLAKRRRFKPLLLGSMLLAVLCLAIQLYPRLVTQHDAIRVGVSAGWSEEVMKVAQRVAHDQYQLNIEIVPFNDYVLPNTALANGNIDANIFQHIPYLNAQNKARGYQLAPIGKTFVYPMGFYSKRVKQMANLPTAALVALPNDPSNQARSLLLLEKAGLITLRPNAGASASLADIVSNPKHLRFKLLDAAQLPRVLKDADLVALTNDYIGPAGFTLDRALLKEGTDSLYANVVVARSQDKADPRLKALVDVMHSPAVREKTVALFPHGAAIPAN